MTPAERTQHSDGVFFRPEDYAGLWRRLIADAVDVSVALVVRAMFSMVGEKYGVARLLFWILVVFAYFVLLKRSSGTLGYRITEIRIVNLQGEVPSVPVVMLRLLFSLAIPSGFIWDLMIMHIDPHRQALRDKLFHTYVVKFRAQPAGRGPIAYDMYFLWTYALLLPLVRDGDQALPHEAAR